jgi:hypothetical protein
MGVYWFRAAANAILLLLNIRVASGKWWHRHIRGYTGRFSVYLSSLFLLCSLCTVVYENESPLHIPTSIYSPVSSANGCRWEVGVILNECCTRDEMRRTPNRPISPPNRARSLENIVRCSRGLEPRCFLAIVYWGPLWLVRSGADSLVESLAIGK